MSANRQNDIFEDDRILAVALRLPSFEEALARVLYLVEHRRPCGLVVGLAGTGKTLLLGAVFRELCSSKSSRTSCRPLQINLRASGGAGLPWTLATRMGLSPSLSLRSEAMWRSIEDRFQGAAMSGLPMVPIIDHLEQTDSSAVLELGRCCQLALQFGSTVLLSVRPPLSGDLADVVRPLCDLRIELPLWTAHETSTFVSQILQEGRLPEPAPGTIDAIHACAGGRMRDTLQVLRLAVFAAQTQELDRIDA
ncbi:MAG: hypothetical protein AB7I48_05775, partial [Planctomycetaceae bacterium]